ncbi:cyclase family protein [Novosphingobium sp. JCM 18896]|uniref:cyclase family protein n=1 Tax=Novosphingobium sp. JCM 18896 TaxID=2989731 RepID=UPI002221AFD5|nr:cyclase family protein [Novosphingobium sp. JCM 18896]MCW1431712.1 cyclase family protein [Novosphingobium sp. JCM 18896]
MDFRETGKRLSNWGRWGAEDRVGTLNHLTPARVAAAAQGVRSGRIIPLGLPLSNRGIQVGLGGRVNPIHMMTLTPPDFADRPDKMIVADDAPFLPLQSVTQWDGLGHVGYDDLLYNGVPAHSITTGVGSAALSIDQIAKHGVAGRGLLLDIARLKGKDRLEAGEAITSADLDAALVAQGCQTRPGDILILRTGWLRCFTVDGDAAAYWNGEPGITLDCAEWLQAREIAALASDNWGIEAMPADDSAFEMPVHCVLIRDLGMTLGEVFVLDELAEICAAEKCWSFFFTAPPLLVVGGVGSPLTPLAIL